MCGELQCFPFILAAALVRSGLLKVTALRLWPLGDLIFGGVGGGGDSLVDSVFEEVPLVSNTDELSVVTLASLDAALPVCRLPAREPHLSQDKHTAVTI